MRRRPLLLVLVLAAVTATLLAAAPAQAVTAIGPVVTVVPAPAGCTIDHVDGDAEISPFNGVIRGFANLSGTGCGEDAVWFFGRRGGSWTFQRTPYQGQVLAAAQYSASHVLFSSGTGGHTYVAWIRGQQPFEFDDRSGALQHRALVGSSFTTDVDASGGQVHVAWQQSGGGTVLAERSAGGAWTKATVSTVESRLAPIVLSRSSQATVLMASTTRIYARTQTSGS